jgi:hypothetical protein
MFTFQVEITETRGNLTKRSVLSAIATLFDPFQFLARFIERAKILIQEKWTQALVGTTYYRVNFKLSGSSETQSFQNCSSLQSLAAYTNQIRKKFTCTYLRYFRERLRNRCLPGMPLSFRSTYLLLYCR